MRNDLYHASGWTKKDHKYIRKEGNRYIYPEDVKKVGNRPPSGTARDILSKQGVKRAEVDQGPYRNGFGQKFPDIHIQRTSNRTGLNDNVVKRQNKISFSPLNYADDRKARYESAPNNPGARGSKSQRAKNNSYPGKKMNDLIKYDNIKNSPVTKQSAPDYKKISEQHANRNAAANGKVVNPSYTIRDKDGNKIARLQSKDKVSSPNQADYKQYSKEHAQEQNRKKAANGAGAKNQEYAKAANAEQKVKKQVKNRSTAANGIVIGEDGKPYRFNLDQYYAKINTGGKKSERYIKDYSQNEDGLYGAKEVGNLGWTEAHHTHSSEAARKAGIEKKAYEAEVKEAIKKTKARNKAEKEKLTKKGKQIVDKIKSTFSKKKKTK